MSKSTFCPNRIEKKGISVQTWLEMKRRKIQYRNLPLWLNRASKLFLLVSSVSMETQGGDGTSFIETWQVLIRNLQGFLCLKARAPIMTSEISEPWGHQWREKCPIDFICCRDVIGWESKVKMPLYVVRTYKIDPSCSGHRHGTVYASNVYGWVSFHCCEVYLKLKAWALPLKHFPSSEEQ